MGEFGERRWTPCCQVLEYDSFSHKVLYSSKDLKNDSWSGEGGGLWYILKQSDSVIDILVFSICFYCLGGEQQQ